MESWTHAKSIWIKRLDEASSRKLFCLHQGSEKSLPRYPGIRTFAKKHEGISGREEWRRTVEEPDHSLERFDDKEVIDRLKISYDKLETEQMKSALMFCAMFPENQYIYTDELVEFLIEDGLLNDAGEGHTVISDLQRASMLEANTKGSKVRMPGAVRAMALRLNNNPPDDDKFDGFLVWRRREYTAMPEERQHVKRVWVHDQDLGDEEGEMNSSEILSKTYPRIRTLRFVSVRGLRPLFVQMIATSIKKTLRSLTLINCVQELPAEIGSMKELRYLTVASGDVRRLPKELGKLVELRKLVLRDMHQLEEIPREAIVGLRSLQVLDMWGTPYNWEAEGEGHLSLDDIEVGIPELKEVRIKLGTKPGFERLLGSQKLRRRKVDLCLFPGENEQRNEDPLFGEDGGFLKLVFSNTVACCLRRLFLHGDNFGPRMGAIHIDLARLHLLENLFLASFRGDGMPEIVLRANSVNNPKLRFFGVKYCRELKLVKLEGRFPFLEKIRLEGCNTLEELALDDGAAGTGAEDSRFPKLRRITLGYLAALSSVSQRPLSLPELGTIVVFGCPELSRIPIDAAGVPKLSQIRGEKEWWDAVKFAGDDTTKPGFQRLFVSNETKEVR